MALQVAEATIKPVLSATWPLGPPIDTNPATRTGARDRLRLGGLGPSHRENGCAHTTGPAGLHECPPTGPAEKAPVPGETLLKGARRKSSSEPADSAVAPTSAEGIAPPARSDWRLRESSPLADSRLVSSRNPPLLPRVTPHMPIWPARELLAPLAARPPAQGILPFCRRPPCGLRDSFPYRK